MDKPLLANGLWALVEPMLSGPVACPKCDRLRVEANPSSIPKGARKI